MSVANWPACIAFTLGEEGGLVDDPSDPGGLTNFGISLAAYPGLDIRGLTRDAATAIYHRDYWARVRGDDLPPGLDLVVFDEAANAGDDRAERILQRCLGVAVDGIVGPQTLAAAGRADPPRLIKAVCAAQLAFYESLRGWSAFGAGWAARLARRQALAFAMVPPAPA